MPPVAILALLATLPLTAMNPTHPLGYKPEAVYDSGQIDNIDAMTGSLNVTIPIGPFLLTYNSNIWNYKTIIEGGNVYTEASPNKKNNAGIGWQLGIGEVYSSTHHYNPTGKWLFVDQFGGRHSFHHHFDRTHEDGDSSVFWSRDGSFLRLTKVSSAVVRIESPDGTTREFVGTSGGNSDYLLTKVWGPHGSAADPDVTYTRTDPDPDDKTETLTVSDRYGRSHILTFYSGYTHLKNPGVVTEVDIESFDGQRAVYTFDYWNKNLDRSCKDDYPGSSARTPAPHLLRIHLPDGTAYEMIEGGQPAYENYCNGVSDRPGFLTRMTLPTGGAYTWTNQEYEFKGPEPWDTSAGVATRQMLDSSGAVLGTWKYKQAYYPKSGADEAESATWVQQPAASGAAQSDCTKHYFFGDSSQSWEQGLPYTKRQPQVDGKHLSIEIWSASNASNGQCAGSKLRSTYLNYRHDDLSYGSGDQSLWTATNRRVADSRVVYHDDGGRYVDVDSSNDDGLGHWRQVITRHNFDETPSVVAERTATVLYDANGTLLYGNPSWQPPGPADPWILGLYSYAHSTEVDATGQTNSRRYFEFDPNTGFLNCTRQTKIGGAKGANDIVQVFVPTARGEVKEVKTYGGDQQALGTGSVCDTADLPSDPEAWVKHTYQYGVRKTSRPFKPNGTQNGSANPWKTYDVDLDASTGLVTASRDPNGLMTTFDYDAMGRPTRTTLASGVYTDTTYSAPTTSAPAKVTSAKRWSGGALFDQAQTQFDDFGRPWKRLHYEGTSPWTQSETLYNARGWVTSQSNMGDLNQTTTYLNYDAFGRPGTIRPPEGPSRDVSFMYAGDREVTQSAKTMVNGQGMIPTAKTTHRDGFGRTTWVKEPTGENGATVTTSYEYDVNGNLTKVVQGPHETGISQTRTFTYNNLGNLTVEKHPEIGSSGNGTVTYTGHDTRANPASRNDGRVHVNYGYDWLGRLTEVRDANKSNRLVTETKYDTATGPGNGKPAEQIRYNYLNLPWNAQGEEAVKVREWFVYRPLDGVMTNRLTSVNLDVDSTRGGDTQTFQVRPVPNQWGLTDRLFYPDCLHASCSGVSAGRQLDTDWSYGRILHVNGWTGDLTYHPSGTWATIPHLNGTQDEHTVKSNNNSRTNSLHTLNPGVLWNTGRYDYDGWGNIHQTGDTVEDRDWYRYDEANRLVRANVKDPSGKRTMQDYDYDAFGNITEVTTFAGQGPQATTIAVNANTNRLSSAGYDGSGNMTTWGGNSYSYDTGNSMVKQNGRWYFLYTFSGERIATIDWQGSIATREVDWTIRGPGNQVLSTFKLVGEDQAGNWSRETDYVWMGRRLLGTEDGSGVKRHYHTDHLGSIRLVTNSSGNKVSEHEYLPYGQELTAAGDGVMKFTGHERDSDTGMDYMHARFYTNYLGRFMSPDSVLGNIGGAGGSWNRYQYGLGNPTRLLDPNGKDEIDSAGCAGLGGWWNDGMCFVSPDGGKPGFSDSVTVTTTPSTFDGNGCRSWDHDCKAASSVDWSQFSATKQFAHMAARMKQRINDFFCSKLVPGASGSLEGVFAPEGWGGKVELDVGSKSASIDGMVALGEGAGGTGNVNFTFGDGGEGLYVGGDLGLVVGQGWSGSFKLDPIKFLTIYSRIKPYKDDLWGPLRELGEAVSVTISKSVGGKVSVTGGVGYNHQFASPCAGGSSSGAAFNASIE